MLNLFLFLSIAIAKPQKRNDSSLEPTTSAVAAKPKCGWKPEYKIMSSLKYCKNPDSRHSMKWIYIGIDRNAIKSQTYKSEIHINKSKK